MRPVARLEGEAGAQVALDGGVQAAGQRRVDRLLVLHVLGGQGLLAITLLHQTTQRSSDLRVLID